MSSGMRKDNPEKYCESVIVLERGDIALESLDQWHTIYLGMVPHPD